MKKFKDDILIDSFIENEKTIDLTKMSKIELEELQKKIKEQQQEIYDEEIRQRKDIAKVKVDKLREHKDLILSFMEHNRTSCSDTNVCNGYGSASYGARCNKCHLIEILNNEWSDDWEVSIDVTITRIE